jgi:hypothetical protein
MTKFDLINEKFNYRVEKIRCEFQLLYLKIVLFENWASLKKLKILIPWSILTSPKIYIIKNRLGSHNIM